MALAALAAASATPADAKARRRHHAPAVASQDFAFNSFTPAAADPRFSFGVGALSEISGAATADRVFALGLSVVALSAMALVRALGGDVAPKRPKAGAIRT